MATWNKVDTGACTDRYLKTFKNFGKAKKSLPIRKPTSTLLDSVDTDYWKAFARPTEQRELGAITSIAFSPIEPHEYLVSSASKISFYSSKTFLNTKSYTKFRQQILCAKYRHDGRVVIGSTETGMVRVFDIERKTGLRDIIKHRSAVHSCGFTADGTKILTCADDKLACVWDMGTGEVLNTFSQHQDSVRCSAIASNSPELFLTGCYDHQARMFDIRANSCIRTVDHGAPIEDIIMFSAGNIFITAGGQSVKVWDLMAGGKLLVELTGHHKTVMSMCLHQQELRFITASLDKHIKVYDSSSYTVVHSSKAYQSPITRVATSPDNLSVVVGMANGTTCAQRQQKKDDVEVVLDNRSDRWMDEPKRNISRSDRKRDYNSQLTKFQTSKALDTALEFNGEIFSNPPEVIVEVIEELIRANSLAVAIAGREGWQLVPILEFISRSIINPNFTAPCSDALNLILDIYAQKTDRLAFVYKQLQAIQLKVAAEASSQRQVGQLLGTIGGVMSMASGQDTSN